MPSHILLDGLTVAVPGIAVLRIYGDGNGWSTAGLPVVPAASDKTEWMLAAGTALHGRLVWILIALIAGHVVMAVAHALLRDGTMSRTAGPLATRPKRS
ncbi:cytochrome b/b6 domain-containing protein [Novosphingobium resinovorum]|uniref:cytochrome b n=1 Tax=Novosphingobium resinovorum TaxID=158500 RepID=UPI0012EA9D11